MTIDTSVVKHTRAGIPYLTLEPARKLLIFAFLATATWYLTWRLGSFNPKALWFSRLLFAAELYGFCTTLMHFFMTWRLTVRRAPEAEPGLTVDVFVPTINEPVALLRKTLLAVLRMDYPHRSWLLDDGRRPEMEELCRELGCGYLTRGDNREAKAGNLNNALALTGGDFIAIFDADHAPKKEFLTSTLGYFRDRSVGFVQTPQDFYNLDSFQHHRKKGRAHAWHEQSVFFRIIQRGKDYWNAAFFCGSCAVIRRSSLDKIGGFATGTVTEDLHTSVRMHKNGFRSIFHAEPLAFGLAPLGVVPFLKQRIRWGQGAMQVWRKEGVFFCKGLTFAQRINYLASSITYFDGWQKGLFYITPAVVLTFGIMPMSTFSREFLLHFVPYYLLSFWAFEEVNRGYGRSVVIEQYNMSRFAAMAWSTLGLFAGAIRFVVTPKELSAVKTFRAHIVPQSIILAGNVLAVAIGIILYRSVHHLPLNALISNVVWASLNAGIAVGVLQFTTSHSKRNRSDYRFSIPLPVQVTFDGGEEVFGTIDDISSAGFRLYSVFPKGLATGDTLAGKIYLPSGEVAFDASVKGLVQGCEAKRHFVKSIGCSFEWQSAEEHDRLDSFLYGSDIEQSINGLGEVIRTPFSWLGMRVKEGRGRQESGVKWNAVRYDVGNGPQTGLVSSAPDGARCRKLITFAPIPREARLVFDVYGGRGVSTLAGFAEGCREIETPRSPLYQFQLSLVS